MMFGSLNASFSMMSSATSVVALSPGWRCAISFGAVATFVDS